MNAIAAKYALDPNVAKFVDAGFLEVLAERPEEKTIKFHIPSMRRKEVEGEITTYSLVWIHPEFNEQFCWYYDETPGDLVNFYLTKDTSDNGEESVDVESVDDLVSWLDEMQSAAGS